jgi:AcrR family transcriptional regulator
MRGEDRRRHILDAATRCFARTGFVGTSTDAIAKEAGVSQPYVVRMFGTKQELFLEVFEGAARRVAAAFSAVLAEGFDPASEEDRARLGAAYTDLLADRDMMLVMLHGFAAGDSPEIGERARASMAAIYDLLRGGGLEADDVRDFIAHGMLLTVLMAMRAPDHLGSSNALEDLVRCAFGDDMPLVLPPGG